MNCNFDLIQDWKRKKKKNERKNIFIDQNFCYGSLEFLFFVKMKIFLRNLGDNDFDENMKKVFRLILFFINFNEKNNF